VSFRWIYCARKQRNPGRPLNDTKQLPQRMSRNCRYRRSFARFFYPKPHVDFVCVHLVGFHRKCSPPPGRTQRLQHVYAVKSATGSFPLFSVCNTVPSQFSGSLSVRVFSGFSFVCQSETQAPGTWYLPFGTMAVWRDVTSVRCRIPSSFFRAFLLQFREVFVCLLGNCGPCRICLVVWGR
jgi:hypothetical protein